MPFKRTVVIYKHSRFERDLQRLSCSPRELERIYSKWGLSPELIRTSHLRQQQARKDLEQLLGDAVFIPAEQATRKDVRYAKLVIALGGDNHFQRVARLLQGQPLVGINSDPETSLGMLTAFNVRSFERAFPRLHPDSLPTEEWMRLDVRVDGTPLPHLALCEVFIGERDRCAMSRHVLRWGRRREEQKSSGLLVATGAGSTGWYHAAARSLGSAGETFPKTSRSFRFIVTEPHQPRVGKPSLLSGELRGRQQLAVTSLNRLNGIVSLDAYDQQPLRYGAVVEITLAAPLLVVTPFPPKSQA